MRRNWDTIRTILIAAEEGGQAASATHILGTHDADACAHVRMMRDAGLITLSGLEHTVHLTWAGRDMLDVIRDDRVWALCQGLIAKAGGLPSDALMAAARQGVAILVDGLPTA